MSASAIEEVKKNCALKKNYTISFYIKLNLIFLKSSTEEDKKNVFNWILDNFQLPECLTRD